jgi:hypothetical protein
VEDDGLAGVAPEGVAGVVSAGISRCTTRCFISRGGGNAAWLRGGLGNVAIFDGGVLSAIIEAAYSMNHARSPISSSERSTGNASETRVQAWSPVVAMIVNLTLSMWLVQRINPVGVILVTVISYLLVLVGPQVWKVMHVLQRPQLVSASVDRFTREFAKDE